MFGIIGGGKWSKSPLTQTYLGTKLRPETSEGLGAAGAGYKLHGASFMPVCQESKACTNSVRRDGRRKGRPPWPTLAVPTHSHCRQPPQCLVC